MTRDLQSIVDSLGRQVHRSVALDDPHMRLLAYNSHFGPVDEVRTASILHRKAPAKVIAWVNGQGIRDATRPMRLPANPDLRMESRVCASVRFRGELLGYLWLVDADESLNEQELELVQAAADTAAEALRVEKLLDELRVGRERELLRDLLSEQADLRRHAADELVEANLIVPSRAAAAIVVRLRMPGTLVTNADRVSIGIALDQIRQSLSPRHALHLVRPDHGLLVVATEDPTLRVGAVEALASRLLDAVNTRLRSGHHPVLVGVGDVQSAISEIATSYGQARQATRVAEIVPSFSPIAVWNALGIYRTLLQFPIEQLKSDVLHPGLLALIGDRSNEELIATLEAFLDSAGSAKRTATTLQLHRATLYYRLRKVEELVGVDLESGDDRLALHLGLKLARLAGLLPAQRTRSRPAGRVTRQHRADLRETEG